MEPIDITLDENEIANKEAIYLFGYLRKKYCNENIKDLDIVLNSLCFSLLLLIHHNVGQKDRKYFLDSVVMEILKNGIKQNDNQSKN